MIDGLLNQINAIPDTKAWGTVTEVKGLIVKVKGLPQGYGVGSQGFIHPLHSEPIPAEIVGFEGSQALFMGYKSLAKVGMGCRVDVSSQGFEISPCDSWKGHVLNGFGDPMDESLFLAPGSKNYSVYAPPISSFDRAKVGPRLDLGVKAINTFTTTCQGQRMGIFSGSGVGKSVLMSQLGRFAKSDVNVIGLIGERGREVREFIEDQLGEEGLAKSIIVVATSDEPALMRRQAAYLTLTIAEYFRDQGQQVLCMIDSVTRFAMALREIGLSIGEPPASKGYTPSVFAELPKLLERAGPGHHDKGGAITGIFTVLVEGDDTNEPISDAVRGILDGHITLDRSIAERNRFPAMNVLKSISRTMPNCNEDDEIAVVSKARNLMASYDDMADMIKLGAYRQGSDPLIDEAIAKREALEGFLSQGKNEFVSIQEGFEKLQMIVGIDMTPEESEEVLE